MTFRVQHLKVAAACRPLMRAAAIALAEMHESGAHHAGSWPFSETAEAHCVLVNTGSEESSELKCVGMIVWKPDEDLIEPSAWISFSWVHPHFRKQGIYRQMLEAVYAEAQTRNLVALESFVLEGNDLMAEVKIQMGFKPMRTVYSLDVKKP